jgi:hypothetical protein
MKRIIQAISGAILAIGLTAGVASADTVNCGNISNTGPGSVNSITCTTSTGVNVYCNNDTHLTTTNNQNASSGYSVVTGNTTGGSSTSGGAQNSNQTNLTVGLSCAPAASSAPAAVTPPAGGQGGGAPVAAAAAPAKPVGGVGAGAPAAAVASLPETGSQAPERDAAIAAVALSSALVLPKLFLSAYRKLAL